MSKPENFKISWFLSISWPFKKQLKISATQWDRQVWNWFLIQWENMSSSTCSLSYTVIFALCRCIYNVCQQTFEIASLTSMALVIQSFCYDKKFTARNFAIHNFALLWYCFCHHTFVVYLCDDTECIQKHVLSIVSLGLIVYRHS